MRNGVHWMFTGLLWILSLMCLWYLTATKADTAMDAMRTSADSVAQELHRLQGVVIQAQLASKEATKRERRQAEMVGHTLEQMQDSLVTLRRIQMDSTADTDTLRRALGESIRLADSLSFQVSAYMGMVDTMALRFSEERRLLVTSLMTADTLLAKQDVMLGALSKRECRILGKPCPSRTAVAVAAFVTGAVVALR